MKVRRDAVWFDNKMKDIQHQFSGFLNMQKDLNPRLETLKIIIVYIFMGGLWILWSDRVLSFFIKEPGIFMKLQTYKGWLYVIVTGLIFYFIISGKIILFKKAINKIFEGYEELSAAHEELLAMEEELSQQFDELEKHRDALMVSDQRYQLAVEGANDGIWDWDIKNETYFFSIKWKSIFGYTDEDLPNKYESWKQLLHPEDRERSITEIENYLSSKSGIYQNTYRLQCKNGDYRWILSRGKAIWDDSGQAVRVAGSHTDISEFIELQECLCQEKELLGNIINDAFVIILVLDSEGRIMEFNQFAERLTGYTKDEVIGMKWTELFVPVERRVDTDKIVQRILNGEAVRNQENQIITKEGRRIDVLWNNNILHDGNGKVLGMVATGLDITERKSMENKLYSLAFYDTLTGLPNRQMFEKTVRERIEKPETNNGKFALLYLDVDNFKNVNDTLGHSYGDKLIQDIAAVLRTMIKGETNVARLGGDEFGIILSDVMDLVELHGKIISIMEAVNKLWILEGNELYITSSIGISTYPEDGQDVQTLLKNADTAMYVAKEHSKNCFAFYTPHMNEKSLNYLDMEKGLRNALSNNEFILYYQPIINIVNGEIVGVEALVRWLHPDKGIIPPMNFISFAEETGLIVTIGENVMNQACQQLEKWSKLCCLDIKISINLSAKQLRQHDLIERIACLINSMKISGKNLVIEITENAALYDLNQSVNTLEKLKELGIQIALDDFGTGYSSLNYLKQLPVDIIKMDKAFVQDICKYSDEKFIAKTVIELAHHMNLTVTAEGIETEEQLKILKDFCCDYGQGYYYSKPISAEEMEALLLSNKKFLS